MQHCSWCFSRTEHSLISKCLITRNVYECGKCGREGCKCMKCSEMARRYPDHADKLCYRCKLLIPTWDKHPDEITESLKLQGRCSWCFNITKHTLFAHNAATRNEYTVNIDVINFVKELIAL